MENSRLDFQHLDRAGRLTIQAVLSPRIVTFGAVALLIAGSWIILIAMATKVPFEQSGPGSTLLQWIPDVSLPRFLEDLLAICVTPAPYAVSDAGAFGALVAMWFLMSLAMMLPSASPLIRTYCEIADTARAGKKPVVHPLWLVGGYLAVWLVAAACFAGAGWAAGALTGSVGVISPVAVPFAATALLFAGLYQFSDLKEACLKKCRNPFSTLFGNWSVKTGDVFVLGIRQGLWCLGCCWALMLVMFAVGVMNIFWMALLALFTAIEKTGRRGILTHIAGSVLLVWAFAVLLISA